MERVVAIFRKHESAISTRGLKKGLKSNQVLDRIRQDLTKLGFQVESGKKRIKRPVLFGENGRPIVGYRIDAYHPKWQAVLEVEAARAWNGGAVFRDLIHAIVMVRVNYLVLAVPNAYKYRRVGRATSTPDYTSSRDLLETLYKQPDFRMPYYTVLIGY